MMHSMGQCEGLNAKSYERLSKSALNFFFKVRVGWIRDVTAES